MRKDVRNDLICIKARASRMVNVNSPHATAQADFTQHSPPANNRHTSPAGSSLNAHNWKLTNPPSPAAPVSARSRQSQPMARLDWPVPFHWPHTLADPCVTASIHPAWEASPERVNGGGGAGEGQEPAEWRQGPGVQARPGQRSALAPLRTSSSVARNRASAVRPARGGQNILRRSKSAAVCAPLRRGLPGTRKLRASGATGRPVSPRRRLTTRGLPRPRQ